MDADILLSPVFAENLENPRNSFRIAVKGAYEINDSVFSANTISAIELENKPKRKVKP